MAVVGCPWLSRIIDSCRVLLMAVNGCRVLPSAVENYQWLSWAFDGCLVLPSAVEVCGDLSRLLDYLRKISNYF